MAIVDELVTLLSLKTSSDAGTQGAAFEKIVGAVEGKSAKLSDKMTKVNKSITLFASGLTKQTKAGKKTHAMLGLYFKGLESVNKISKVGAAVAGKYIGSILGVSAAIEGFTIAGSLSVDSNKRFADSIGVNFGQLQKWQFAMKASGVSTGETNALMQKLAEQYGDVNVGLDSYRETLRSVSGAQIAPIAAVLGISPKTALAIKDMDKDYGSLMKKAESSGAVIDPSAVKNVDALRTVFGETEQQIKGIAGTISGSLAPVVTGIIKKFSDWIAKNQDFIKSDIVPVLKGIIKGVTEAGSTIVGFIGDLGNLIGKLFSTGKSFDKTNDTAVIVKDTLIALASVIGVSMVASLATMGAALLANPIFWITALIVGIIASIAELIKHWVAVKEAAGKAWDFIVDKVKFFVKNFTTIGLAIQAVQKLWPMLKTGAAKAFDFMSKKVKGLLGFLNPVKKAFSEVGHFFSNLFGGDDKKKELKVAIDKGKKIKEDQKTQKEERQENKTQAVATKQSEETVKLVKQEKQTQQQEKQTQQQEKQSKPILHKFLASGVPSPKPVMQKIIERHSMFKPKQGPATAKTDKMPINNAIQQTFNQQKNSQATTNNNVTNNTPVNMNIHGVQDPHVVGNHVKSILSGASNSIGPGINTTRVV